MADAALAAHADVAAKLEEVEAHTALLTAVRLCTMLPMHAAKLMSPCMNSCCRDNAPFLEGLTCLRLLHIDSMSCISIVTTNWARASFPWGSARLACCRTNTRLLPSLRLQALNAAEAANSTSAAEAALGQVTAMLQPGQAPGSQQLRRLHAQLLLQLSRYDGCPAVPWPPVVLSLLVLRPGPENCHDFCAFWQALGWSSMLARAPL